MAGRRTHLISIHLSDEEITAAAAGERSPRVAGHLEICSDCWHQMAMYRERMTNLRQDVCFSASRSAIDWGRQSRSIMQRIAGTRSAETRSRTTGWTLATAALSLALILFAFVGYQSAPPSIPKTGSPISDAALLAGVEDRINEDVPDALQPAGLLVNEMGGIERQSNASHSHSHTRTTQ